MGLQEAEKLFAGSCMPRGGLSNARELGELCPAEFRGDNPWTKAATEFFHLRLKPSNWHWASKDSKECLIRLSCFLGIFASTSLVYDDKMAVAGWMLSEMLAEVPQQSTP